MAQNIYTVLVLLVLSVAFGCSRAGEADRAEVRNDHVDAPPGSRNGQQHPHPDVRNGQADAKRDLADGHLQLHSFGLPAPWVPEYARLLKERLGVEYRPVAGCVVTEELVSNTAAYNKVMISEIERRFGTGVLQQIRDEARKAATSRSIHSATQHNSI
jgi:hypothetical protein